MQSIKMLQVLVGVTLLIGLLNLYGTFGLQSSLSFIMGLLIFLA